MLPLKTVGEIIQSNLELKNMTQAELGKRLGLSQKAISKYVTGKSLPSIETLGNICSILDVNVTAFFPNNQLKTNEELEVLQNYRLLDEKSKIVIRDLLTILRQRWLYRSSGKSLRSIHHHQIFSVFHCFLMLLALAISTFYDNAGYCCILWFQCNYRHNNMKHFIGNQPFFIPFFIGLSASASVLIETKFQDESYFILHSLNMINLTTHTMTDLLVIYSIHC